MKTCRLFAIPVAMTFAMAAYAQGGSMGGAMMAQNAGGPVSLTAGIVQQYNSVKGNIEKAADAMPEDGVSI